jgi:hypothetical protein
MNLEEAMIKTVGECRGRILQFVIFTEVLMDEYIAQQFFSDIENMYKLRILLLGEINLQKKAQLFLYFLEENGAVSGDKLKALRKEIDEIIDHRNVFAHFPLLFSPETKDKYRKEKTLTFTKMRRGKLDGKNQISLHYGYSQDALNSLISRIINLNSALQDITGVHRDTEPPIEPNPTGGI